MFSMTYIHVVYHTIFLNLLRAWWKTIIVTFIFAFRMAWYDTRVREGEGGGGRMGGRRGRRGARGFIDGYANNKYSISEIFKTFNLMGTCNIQISFWNISSWGHISLQFMRLVKSNIILRNVMPARSSIVLYFILFQMKCRCRHGIL